MKHESTNKRDDEARRLFRESMDRGPATTWRREIGEGITAEGAHRAGLPHGPYREWFKDGQLRVSRNFRYGQWDGIFRQYAPDGRQLVEFEMSEGTGVFVECWDSGLMRFRWLCFRLDEKPSTVEEYFDIYGKRFRRAYTLKSLPCRTKKRFEAELAKYGLVLPPEATRHEYAVWMRFTEQARAAVRSKAPKL